MKKIVLNEVVCGCDRGLEFGISCGAEINWKDQLVNVVRPISMAKLICEDTFKCEKCKHDGVVTYLDKMLCILDHHITRNIKRPGNNNNIEDVKFDKYCHCSLFSNPKILKRYSYCINGVTMRTTIIMCDESYEFYAKPFDKK